MIRLAHFVLGLLVLVLICVSSGCANRPVRAERSAIHPTGILWFYDSHGGQHIEAQPTGIALYH